MRFKRAWFVPAGLAILAIVLLGGGILWGVVSGVAIPDQDPTAAMVARARYHMRIVNAMLLGGLLALAGAGLSVVVLSGRAVLRRRRTE